MDGNICPKCGNAVMPYLRFIREAEPYKISLCASCGAKLKRSPKVYAYLVLMIIILIAVSIPVFLGMAEAHMALWLTLLTAIAWLACWSVLINYLSWRYVGWMLVQH